MSNQNFRIVLTDADKHSGTWDKLQRYWEQELNDLRKANDHHMPEIETARLRGRISQIKAFMSMDNPLPSTVPIRFNPAE